MSGRPRTVRAVLGSVCALVLALGVTTPVAHAQVIAAAVTGDSAAGVALTMTPGATGIAALDAACLGNEIVVSGSGVGTIGIEALGLFNVPGLPVPIPAGGGAEYIPSNFNVSGGECAGSSGPVVLSLDGSDEVNGSVFDCPNLSGTFVQSGGIHEFAVSGTCAVNIGITMPMSFSSVGILTAGVPVVGGDTDVAVLYSKQLETCC